jgi:hypothetical protein
VKKHLLVSRRAVLRGLGAAVALPLLEAMEPLRAFGAPATKAPLRMAFVYVPNGKNMAAWTPKNLGDDFDLPATLEPLTPFKNDVMVLSGLTLDKARPHGDGGGDHARAMSAFLTGSQPRKTHGEDIRVGVSADQVAAQKTGRATRFPSLEIGCDLGKNAGNCDSGYSCAYSANLSWRTESTPMSKEIDPKLLFERLFLNGKGPDGQARRRQSVLDLVAEDARDLKVKLGATDQRKLDEYLSGVRELEHRLAKSMEPAPEVGQGKMQRPTGVPKDFAEHIKIMADLLTLAFQADLTRVCTFVFANEGSNRSYRFIDVPEGHHDLSHHENKKEKLDKIQKINQFHVSHFAYLLGKLKGIKEGSGTMLDNCMIVYGSGNSDGNRHNHDELPILLAGKAGGAFKSGRHVRYKRETPLMNLYLSMLDQVGAGVPTLGDSTGRLPDLEG